jgi:hypothetical protein
MSIECLRPEHGIVRGAHQLGGHLESPTGSANASLEDGRHVQRFADRARGQASAREREDRRASGHPQAGHPPERDDELVRKAVTEMLVGRVAAGVDEGKYRD